MELMCFKSLSNNLFCDMIRNVLLLGDSTSWHASFSRHNIDTMSALLFPHTQFKTSVHSLNVLKLKLRPDWTNGVLSAELSMLTFSYQISVSVFALEHDHFTASTERKKKETDRLFFNPNI